MGLNPGTLGSHPGPKVGAKPLSHPGIPDCIYLFMRDREREKQRHRQREKQAPHREHDVGLNPRSPGSHPGLKAVLNRWATGAAHLFFFKDFLFIEMQRHRQREKQAPCREPDVGLDPGSPGSRPGLQAALNRCATRAAS